MCQCRTRWAGQRTPELSPEQGDKAAMQSEWGDGRWRDIEGTGNTHAKAPRLDQAPEGQCGCRVSPAGFYQPERHWYLMLSVKESLIEFKCHVVLIYILR